MEKEQSARPIFALQSDRMDTRIIKIALSAAAFGFTVYLFATGSWGYGIWMLLLTTILVVFTLRSVRLLWSLIQLRRQKLDKAVKIVDGITDKTWFGLNFDGGNFRTDDPYRDLRDRHHEAGEARCSAHTHRDRQ